MLIRPRGYNDGAQEYLEEGKKSGREKTRDELDERVILYGDLDLTRMIYQSIPNKGQDRYLSYTLAFREDEVDRDTLHNVTTEFRQFLMHAYREDEFNFYAEAHIPKIKELLDKSTGELVARKPHIHIIIPRKNMLSGLEANPAGMHAANVSYMEAFQEYLNQKYRLASPRDHVRADVTDAASVLSRFKGDDFYGKNRDFKKELVREVVETEIFSRSDFYKLVSNYGETRIRNEGEPNEYIAVKLKDDAKFTNLKETIFHDDFIVNRALKKPPLDPALIQRRLLEWPKRAMEIKYVSKATKSFRLKYQQSTPDQQNALLSLCKRDFYTKYGAKYDVQLSNGKRSPDHQRSVDEAGAEYPSEAAFGVQDLSGRDVANHGRSQSTRERWGSLLLPGDAHLHLGQQNERGDHRLRPAVPTGGGEGDDEYSVKPRRHSTVPEAKARPAGSHSDRPSGGSGTSGASGSSSVQRRKRRDVIPPYARNPRRVATVDDIRERGRRLFRSDPELPGRSLPIALKPTGQPLQVPQHAPQKTLRRFRSADSRRLPPHAKNPRRVASITDIEARGKRLFATPAPGQQPLQIKLAKIRPASSNKSASTVAAYLNRKSDSERLTNTQRQQIRRIDRRFFDSRKLVYADSRLSRQDKVQLLSILTFERLKGRADITDTKQHNEASYMGSAEIRKLIDEANEGVPDFSISGTERSPESPIRSRVQQLIRRLTSDLDKDTDKDLERERELTAKDIYTKKARFSQNVHYLDKKTDKTLFVDTGKSISMRKGAINEAGVTLALQMAQQRFGSTLTIKGSKEFKRLVVEVVAKNGLDVHFTDKKMNQALAERRAELGIEADALHIGGQDLDEPEIHGPETSEKEKVHAADPSLIRGELVNHGAAPYQNNPRNRGSYFVTLKTDAGDRTLWGMALEKAMVQGNFKPGEQIRLRDLGETPVTVTSQDAKGNFVSKEVIRREWSAVSEDTAEAHSGNSNFQVSPEVARASVNVADGESFLVASQAITLERLGNIDLEILMEEPAFAREHAGFQAVQIVSGSDTTDAGTALVAQLMRFALYRTAFKDAAAGFYADLPADQKREAQPGFDIALDLVARAEAQYGRQIETALPGSAPASQGVNAAELEMLREKHGSRIEFVDLVSAKHLNGEPPVFEVVDYKFGSLGVFQGDYSVALDRGVVRIEQRELAAQANGLAEAGEATLQPATPAASAILQEEASVVRTHFDQAAYQVAADPENDSEMVTTLMEAQALGARSFQEKHSAIPEVFTDVPQLVRAWSQGYEEAERDRAGEGRESELDEAAPVRSTQGVEVEVLSVTSVEVEEHGPVMD